MGLATIAERHAMKPGVKKLVSEKFVLAADLGQSNDPTAIAVLHHRTHSCLTWRDNGWRSDKSNTFDIRFLQRLPLHLSYVDQVQEVKKLLARPPLSGRADFIVDATGVGRAVADLFNDAGVVPVQVTITAGTEQSGGFKGYHVPKSVLISALDARLHTGELRFAAELQEAGTLADELKDFRRKVSAAGRYSYEARVGRHDDLVLSVALALWGAIGRPKPPVPISGFYHIIR
jgi:hypothetical protein